MRATELYALSQGKKCEGSEYCYWCAAPCGRTHRHNDPRPSIFYKRPNPHSRHPSSPWICQGCRLFARKRITIPFLGGGYKDSRSPKNFSWLITPEKALAIREQDYGLLLEALCHPPDLFSLCMLDEAGDEVHLQYAKVCEVKGRSPDLTCDFTLNNLPMQYCPNDLKQVVSVGVMPGLDPGTRALATLFGIPEMAQKGGKERGRPTRKKRALPKPQSGTEELLDLTISGLATF